MRDVLITFTLVGIIVYIAILATEPPACEWVSYTEVVGIKKERWAKGTREYILYRLEDGTIYETTRFYEANEKICITND